MCGRLYATLSPQQVQAIFRGFGSRGITKLNKQNPGAAKRSLPDVNGAEKCYPSYNAAPTRFMPVVMPDFDESKGPKKQNESQVVVRIQAMKWGMLVPNSNDLVINGRLEELSQKPFFRGLLERKRCVVTFNGYFEWKSKSDNSK